MKRENCLKKKREREKEYEVTSESDLEERRKGASKGEIVKKKKEKKN